MSLIAAMVGIIGSRGPATLSADFGVISGGAPTVTSATRTFTVPGGGARSINFDVQLQTCDDVEYQKNGGAWTPITESQMGPENTATCPFDARCLLTAPARFAFRA
ncbi:MAG: hypothetical protein HC779_01105 [Phyllobacteriaceae bacterium]|nr:hypothetical protein [Phyllobacteriaceae bacterium]